MSKYLVKNSSAFDKSVALPNNATYPMKGYSELTLLVDDKYDEYVENNLVRDVQGLSATKLVGQSDNTDDVLSHEEATKTEVKTDVETEEVDDSANEVEVTDDDVLKLFDKLDDDELKSFVNDDLEIDTTATKRDTLINKAFDKYTNEELVEKLK